MFKFISSLVTFINRETVLNSILTVDHLDG